MLIMHNEWDEQRYSIGLALAVNVRLLNSFLLVLIVLGVRLWGGGVGAAIDWDFMGETMFIGFCNGCGTVALIEDGSAYSLNCLLYKWVLSRPFRYMWSDLSIRPWFSSPLYVYLVLLDGRLFYLFIHIFSKWGLILGFGSCRSRGLHRVQMLNVTEMMLRVFEKVFILMRRVCLVDVWTYTGELRGNV